MRTALLLLLAGSAFAQASPESAKVDQIFAIYDKPDSPGCAVSVMHGGHTVYKHAYGMADLDHDLPLKTTSVFHVASISKQFTAASILLLAEDHKLSLDDPIRKYLPEVADFGKPITIRHLIHHISGLRDQWSFLGLAGWRYSKDLITDDDVLAFVAGQKALNFPTGSKYMYSNTGFTLLAQIVKRVSRKSLREFTTERIFKPLGMTSTHFRDNHAEIVKGMAYGYDRENDKAPWEMSITNFDTVGATSLLTTVEDLAKWDENFFQAWARNGMTAKMLTRGVLNNGEVLPYAFGLVVGNHRGLPTVDHGGADAGYRAGLIRFPDEHFSVACLCNLAGVNPSQLAYKVADIYLVDRMQPAVGESKPGTVTLQPDAMKSVSGLYWNPAESELREVKVAKGKLRYVVNGVQEADLLPLSDHRFHVTQGDLDVEIAGGQLIEARQKEKTTFAMKPAGPKTADVLKQYAGVYRLDELESEWTLAVDKDHLTLTRLRARPGRMDPQIAGVFTNRGGVVEFTRGRDGQVNGFVLNSGRIRDVHFHRLK
ncbi:MAG: serine hydrolase domain-containing protein [Bryobacteraceae bacterium]